MRCVQCWNTVNVFDSDVSLPPWWRFGMLCVVSISHIYNEQNVNASWTTNPSPMDPFRRARFLTYCLSVRIGEGYIYRLRTGPPWIASSSICKTKWTFISKNVEEKKISFNSQRIKQTFFCISCNSATLIVQAHISLKKLHNLAIESLISLGRNFLTLGGSRLYIMT